MSWVMFVTIWIIFQSIFRAARAPYECNALGKNDMHVSAYIVGRIGWGLLMIGSLYMAGLYD